MQKTCLKCGHVNTAATGAALEPCPSCGAIYSRVEAAMAGGGPDSAFPSRRASPAAAASGPLAAKSRSIDENDVDIHAFAEDLRRSSLYPTFRGLVRLIFFVWMALAALSLLGAIAALVSGSGVARVGGFLGGLFFALFFAVVAKVTKEAALMLADLSDASVHIAARVKS